MATWNLTSLQETEVNKRFDSEFFQPKYVDIEEKIKNLHSESTLGQLGKFVIGPFGSAFHVSNFDSASSFRYIRGKDVKPFQLKDDDNVFIPIPDYKRLEKYSVKPQDLIISVVGTIGNVSIIPSEVQGIFSCKSTILRNTTVDPFYLLAYLNSNYGKTCLLRRQRGAIQTGLNLEDLSKVPVPIFSNSTMNNIGELVNKGLNLQKESKHLYTQAIQLLERELGLDQLSLNTSKTYHSSFQEVISEKRINSEYFSPSLKSLLRLPCFNGSTLLSNIFKIIRGKTPVFYSTSGIPVLKTKNIRTPVVDMDRINDFVNNQGNYVHVNEGDLLLASMGVGSLGRISFIHDPAIDCIIDGTIRILRIKSEKYLVIPTMLFLSLSAGQKLIYRGIVGSTGIISLPDDYLKKIPIPLFSMSLCDRLNTLVISSIQAKDESGRLLSQAKSEVETLIEQAAQKA